MPMIHDEFHGRLTNYQSDTSTEQDFKSVSGVSGLTLFWKVGL